jgi:hypothetical protein
MSKSYHICADCPDSLDDCYPDTTTSCDMKARNHPQLIQLKVPEVNVKVDETEVKSKVTRFSLLEID